MNTNATDIADEDGKPRVVVPAEEIERRRRAREQRRALVGSILDEGAEEKEAASS